MKKFRVNTEPIVFVGWTYGNKGDRKYLRSMGVEGKMNWAPHNVLDKDGTPPIAARIKNGIFTYCKITMEVANKLKDECSFFSFSTFTGIDKDGNQTQYQPLYKWDEYFGKRSEWVE